MFFVRWFSRVVVWDGIVAVLVWYSPSLATALFPNKPDAILAVAATVPIAALGLRCIVGLHCISKNQCSPTLRNWQFATFMTTIMTVFFIEAISIAVHEFRGNGVDIDALILFAVMFLVYFAAMTFAMYPGYVAEKDPFEMYQPPNSLEGPSL
jgi:hypothetical protein